MNDNSTLDLTALRSRVSGPVLAPGDGGFDEEVSAWNLATHHSPQVAVGVTSENDVVEAVRFARENRLPVILQATGHGTEAVTSGMLILTRRLDRIVVDPDTRLATVGAGANWGAVAAAVEPFGLTPVSGSASTVGVVGYLLGGGLGPLIRSHGFSSDWVRGFRVVTAAGEIVTADRRDNSELFWALRGGKGGFGVVTEVTIELAMIPSLVGGSVVFDAPDIEQALRAWVEYADDADPSVSTSAAIVRAPDLPQVPEPLRGRTLLQLRFAYPGDPSRAALLAAPLRSAAPVYLDQIGELGPGQLARIHNDPTDPGPGWSRGRLLRSVDQDFASVLLEHAGPGAQVPFVAIEIRHLGSAAAIDVPEGSATGGRSSAFTLNVIGAPNPALFETVLPSAAATLFGVIDPWISSETTINWAGHLESREQYESAWPPEIFERLQGVRAAVDPDGLFPFGI